MVPPFDDPAIVAGQGTLGLEIMEDVPDVEQSCSMPAVGRRSGLPVSRRR
jgi:threonine dehydratase